MSKAKMTAKVVDAAMLGLEKAGDMLERGVKVKGRIQNAVNEGKGKGRATAQRKSASKNPMRGPGLSPMTASGAPVAVSYPQGPTYHVVTKTTPEVTSVRGRAFLGNVNSTGSSYNIVGGTYSLNPILLTDRLAVMATTFDKYVYKRAKVCYVPFAATSQQGQVYLYMDRDYLDPLADPTSVGQIMSQYNAIADQPWKNMSTSLGRDPTEKRTYFTLLNQAQLPETEQFRVNCYVTASGYTGIVGQLYLEYDLDLVGPTFAPSENAIGPLSAGGNFISNFAVASWNTSNQPLVFASSHGLVGSTSNCFGIPDTSSNRVWEVVLADVGSATGYTPTGVKWQSSAGPQVTFNNGQTIYLVRTAYTGTVTGNTFNIFEFYQDAMSGDSSQALYNSNTSNTYLLGAATVLVRPVSNAGTAGNP